jgi:hypothetical protein
LRHDPLTWCDPIHNARLYTERSHIADVLQPSLRPGAPPAIPGAPPAIPGAPPAIPGALPAIPGALPAIPGAELAARVRPAGARIDVGGDFYDGFRSGDGVWIAFVGDSRTRVPRRPP